MKILAFAGSNSKQSINKKLLNFVLKQLKNIEIELIDIRDYEMPIYSIDRENENSIPKEAEYLYKKIENVDGIITSLAEHNGNFSVALKNILDWISRINMSFLTGKKIFLLSTSPGSYGGGNVMDVAKKYFSHFAGGEIVASSTFPFFYENFENGNITNEELKKGIIEQTKIFQDSLSK